VTALRALEIRPGVDVWSRFALRVVEQVEHGGDAAVCASNDEDAMGTRECETVQGLYYSGESHFDNVVCII
jgi:hypothetical protein